MTLLIFSYISLLSLFGIYFFLWKHSYLATSGNISHKKHEDFVEIVKPHIDLVFSFLYKSWSIFLHVLYLLILLALRGLSRLFAKWIEIIEERVGGIVDQVRGKGEINKNGKASPFLEKIRKHKEKIDPKDADKFA